MRRAHVNSQPRLRCASLAYFQAIPLDRVQEPDLAQAEIHKHADPKSALARPRLSFSARPGQGCTSDLGFVRCKTTGLCGLQLQSLGMRGPAAESSTGRPGEQAGSSNRIFWHLALHMPASCGDRLKNSLSNMDICSSESIPKCWMYPWHWRCLDGFLRSLGFTYK